MIFNFKKKKFKIYSLLVVKNEGDIIVSSLKDAIRWSDKIIVIDAGNILDIGTHEELLDRCNLYKEIHDSQNKKEVK